MRCAICNARISYDRNMMAIDEYRLCGECFIKCWEDRRKKNVVRWGKLEGKAEPRRAHGH